MKLKAIVVDDEIGAREILAQLLSRFCPDVEVVASCIDVESAVEKIKQHKPDLVFLDVEMPKFAGYEIVDFFDDIDFNIIFITAYDKYAIRAFEISAIDYLLKPIEISRLKSAVEKAKRHAVAKSYKEKLSLLSEDMKRSEQKYSYVDKGYTNYVSVEEIIAFEAQRSYTLIHLTNERSILLSKNISTIEEELNEMKDLIRVHRSWIVNMTQIDKYSKSCQEIHLKNKLIAKISRQNKAAFETLLAEG